MNKILVAILLVSAVVGMTMPVTANPLSDSMNTATGGANTKTITPSISGYNTASTSVTQTLTSSGAQTMNIHDILAGSGDALGAVASVASTAQAGNPTSGATTSGAATSGDASITDAMIQAGCCGGKEDGNGCCGGVETEAETGDAKSIAKTGESESGDAKSIAKSEKNSATATIGDKNDITSGDAKNVVIQKVTQDATADIHTTQKLIQGIKIKEFQKSSAEVEPYVEFEDSVLAEGNTNTMSPDSKIENKT